MPSFIGRKGCINSTMEMLVCDFISHISAKQRLKCRKQENYFIIVMIQKQYPLYPLLVSHRLIKYRVYVNKDINKDIYKQDIP